MQRLRTAPSRLPYGLTGSHARLLHGAHRVFSAVLGVVMLSTSALISPATALALTVDSAQLASKRLSAGDSHSLAVGPDGGVLAWGDNFYNQCDVPSGLDDVVAVAAGYTHSLALRSDGTVEAWGGESGLSYVPPNTTDAVAIAAGYNHSLVVSENGTVTAAGDNNAGKCDVPSGLSGVVAVSAGYDHSLALRSNGSVAAWGSNAFGQCNVPVGLNNVVAVAAGGLHSLALRSDGTVVAWGRSSEKQCNVPAGLNGVVQIAAGLRHSLALKSDGTVVAWGGVTELFTDASVSVPAGLTNAVAVSAGGQHSMAALPDGSLATWGSNRSGQTLGITSVHPLPWSTDVSGTETFTIGFSAPIQPGSTYAQVALKDPAGNLVAIERSISGSHLRIKPKAPLNSNTRYTVLVPDSAVKDAWGNTIIGTSFDYTTPDLAPPVVMSVNPHDGAQVVAATPVLSIAFDEGLVAGPAFADVALRDARGIKVPCSVTIGGSGKRVLVVTPTAELTRPGSFSLIVPADALQDVRGNRFAGTVTTFDAVPIAARITFSAPSSSPYASVKVYGYLRDASGSPLGNRPVQIQASYASGGWRQAATVYTDADGRFIQTIAPTATTTYRAYFAGDATYRATASASRTVRPVARRLR